MCASFGDDCPHPPWRSPPRIMRECGRVCGSCASVAQVRECASTDWGRWQEIMAVLVPLSRVSSTAHIVELWQLWGSVRGDTIGVQAVCFL